MGNINKKVQELRAKLAEAEALAKAQDDLVTVSFGRLARMILNMNPAHFEGDTVKAALSKLVANDRNAVASAVACVVAEKKAAAEKSAEEAAKKANGAAAGKVVGVGQV